jgi:hypothetical protein
MNFISGHAEDPLVKWIRKHSDEPFSAGKRWVIEHLQFGACMFDPSGLKERYVRLVEWPDGFWVNYWTETSPKLPQPKHQQAIEGGQGEEGEGDASKGNSTPTTGADVEEGEDPVNDLAVLETMSINTGSDITPSASTTDTATTAATRSPPPETPKSEAEIAKAEEKALKAEEKARKKEEKELKKLQKQQEKANKPIPGHHFIVRPNRIPMLGGNEKWEKVVIEGADNEVEAHCGLFIRTQNTDYDGFVERVAQRVNGWCETVKPGQY